jgi:hypothetical protein
MHIYHVTSGTPVATILRPARTPKGTEVRTVIKHVTKRARAPDRRELVGEGAEGGAEPRRRDQYSGASAGALAFHGRTDGRIAMDAAALPRNFVFSRSLISPINSMPGPSISGSISVRK